MSINLLTTRRFAPLFWCQFFSAFNDNFLKNSLVFLILYKWALSNADALITFAGAIFIFPYFILSALGGEVADRFDKALIAQRLKLAELGVAAVAVVGFWFDSLVILLIALFLIGVIAALFGPIKYGILPDHLAESELPAGNALVEGATFVAILTGTMVAGLAAQGSGPAEFSGLMVAFGLLCWASALFIPPTGEGAPNLTIDVNIVGSTFTLLRDLYRESRLWWGGIVVSWFWGVGAVVMSLMPPMIKDSLGGNEQVVLAYLAVFTIAIALGSGLASWLAAGRIVLIPTVFGAILIAIFSLDLGWAIHGLTSGQQGLGVADVLGTGTGVRVAIDLAGLAIGGGLFIVPSFAAVQAWAAPDRRARAVAAVNVLNAAFMTVGGLGVAMLQGYAGISISTLMLAIGVLNIIAAGVILRTMPTSPVRDLLSVIFRAFFRLEITGLENLHKAGPNAIIALNHVSFLDAAVALSFLEREPVYAIDTGIAQRWWVRPFLRFTRAMPLDPTKAIATRTLIHAVKAGDPLIIFPEGRLTVTGSLMKVYDGAAMIADKSEAMLVPVRTKGLERTFFTYLGKSQVRRSLLPKVTVTILEPVRLKIDPALKGKRRRLAAGAMLYTVMSDLIYRTTSTDRTIMQAVIEAAAAIGSHRVAIEDPLSGALSYGRLLVAANVLGRKLMAYGAPGDAMGVMLPNANAAVVTILAVMTAGRVPAMINFTSGSLNINHGITAADIKYLLTSRAFVEKAHLDKIINGLSGDVTVVYLEDVRGTVTFGDKLRGYFTAKKPLVQRAPDDPAAILFTSGSEGTPKGVVLSHRNMLANAAQAEARIDFGMTDKVFNVLPLFHSFGLTVGLILPLVSGVRIFLYPSPLHYRIVPEMIYGTNSTILFGTDTFLAGYARSAHSYDFRSLRYILAGAEPVRETTRRVYAEKFGLRILEGYGVTETAPAIALNTPMFNKFGTVGRLLPGMEARLDPVPGVSEGGRLHLRGPNVMLGYLRADNPGVLDSPEEGWHDTGDIVTIDAEGFVAIKGRAKRFAKIGGEMISLAAVEALAGDLWPDAVSGAATVPDPRKGERLVLVTTKHDPKRSDFLAFARARGASEMMVPTEVLILDKLPVLGSGKVDNIALTNFVRERAKLEGAA